MKKMEEERLRELDRFSLSWLLRKISLGNIMRGIYRLADALEPALRCVKSGFADCRDECGQAVKRGGGDNAAKKAKKEPEDAA